MRETEHPPRLSGQGAPGQPPGDPERPPELRSLRATLVTRAIHVWFLLTRSMTLGVRAAVFDRQGRVFLVRHGYVSGWHMPGGGVERGETVLSALAKELAEEGNLVSGRPPELFSVYYNRRTSRRDHVVFYICRDAEQTAPVTPSREILEAGFFSLDALPEGTTAATRRRLLEIAGEEPIRALW